MKELTLRELQLQALEILKEVHEFCLENNIMYSMYCGSMIGVIRHKGFIPWDDDIDIIMKRPDYERFCKIFKSDKFKIICANNDKSCGLAFTRVCDIHDTISISECPWCDSEVGAWIDIFPADGTLDNKKASDKHYTHCRKIWLETLQSRRAQLGFDVTKGLKSKVYHFVRKVLYLNGARTHSLVKNLSLSAKKYDITNCHYWSQMTCMGDNSKEHNRTETFTSTSLMPFEDTEVCVMNGWDEVLTTQYGNYMQLPPIEKRVPKTDHIHFYWKNR